MQRSGLKLPAVQACTIGLHKGEYRSLKNYQYDSLEFLVLPRLLSIEGLLIVAGSPEL